MMMMNIKMKMTKRVMMMKKNNKENFDENEENGNYKKKLNALERKQLKEQKKKEVNVKAGLSVSFSTRVISKYLISKNKLCVPIQNTKTPPDSIRACAIDESNPFAHPLAMTILVVGDLDEGKKKT